MLFIGLFWFVCTHNMQEELEVWRRQKRMGMKKKKEESKDSSKSTPEDTDTVIISKDDIEKIKASDVCHYLFIFK